jgi:cyclophilin family peptidyl-prolyl cis-trans isomerase
VNGAFQYGDGACPPATPPSTPKRHFTSSPKRCLRDGVDYRAIVKTSEGSFTVDLLEKDAPGTVNNFVVLARWGFFDGLTFHRVAPGFVIQGGDPNGDGSGGPGYEIADELPSSLSAYKTGAVAMANGGPNSNGSQFFVCENCSGLPAPNYSLFGQVVDGMDTVQAIEVLGSGDGPPSKTVRIEKVTIQEA